MMTEQTASPDSMQLVWPAMEHLESYTAALKRRWSSDTMRPDAWRDELERIAADPALFIAQQVDREGEPGLAEARQLRGGQPEDAGRCHHPCRPHVDAVLVPGAESTGPLTGFLHRGHHGLLVADPPHQVDVAGQQDPPVLGGPALVEEPVAEVVRLLGPSRRERLDLLVREAVEHRDTAELLDEGHVAAR